ncbi:MAG: hypothetical protein HY071_05885 [Chloroflexi bacterium]|nr:hypothetical protein [Chloroflexota bacterium]
MSRILSALAALAVVVASLLVTGTPAAAHERRTVGPYQLAVGFLDEPPFEGVKNSVDFRVTDTRTSKPVEGLEKTVKVDIFSGGLTTPLSLALETRFGNPGAYAAYFVPTKAGSYRFVFKGKIDTTDLNETFESGPGRFDDVGSTVAIQYPQKVPTGGDLSTKLADVQSAVDQARILAIVALALSVVGLGLAVRRRGK